MSRNILVFDWPESETLENNTSLDKRCWFGKRVSVGLSKPCHIVLLFAELNKKKSCQNQAWMLKLQLQESWRLAMLVFVPCYADYRTSCPSLVKVSMASAGTGGLSLLAVQTSFLRTPFNKNSNNIAIALLEESKGI